MKSFKRSYVGDTMVTHPKLFSTLKDLININDQMSVLSVFVNKMYVTSEAKISKIVSYSAANLKVWARCDVIVKETLALFDDIASGYSSAKIATKLENVQMLLHNHGVSYYFYHLAQC